MSRRLALADAARQLAAATRANLCDVDCERCWGTIAAALQLARHQGVA